jgi:cell division protein FtsW
VAVRRGRRWLAAQARGRPTVEFSLVLAPVVVLVVLGLVMTFSASFVQSTRDSGGAFGIFQRQLLWAAVGTPIMAVAALVDYRLWRRVAGPLLVLSLVLATAVLVPGIGVEAHGARRWLDLGPVGFQPSELLKLAVALYLGALLASRWRRLRQGDVHALLLPAVPVIALATGLVLAGPDLETAALVALIGGLALYAAGLPLRILGAGCAAALALVAWSIRSTDFRRNRMAAWFDPMAYAGDYGYQSVQGFIALGSGGVFGRGLGQGRGQWLYVPNAHTDFIYAIIGEEFGLIGAAFTLLLFLSLAYAGVRVALRAPDAFGRLVATGITGWLLAQAAMNMGSVVGLLPVTGVTLPLVSFGGSSLVVTMLAIGILMSVARACGHPAPQGEEGR